jgi:hypothetical protein
MLHPFALPVLDLVLSRVLLAGAVLAVVAAFARRK